MTIATLSIPKCSFDDGINMLDGALSDLDSGRFALAFLMETARPEDHSADVIQCVMCALCDAAADLKTGIDAVTFEHKAFKAWEAKNAQEPGEAGS